MSETIIRIQCRGGHELEMRLNDSDLEGLIKAQDFYIQSAKMLDGYADSDVESLRDKLHVALVFHQTEERREAEEKREKERETELAAQARGEERRSA